MKKYDVDITIAILNYNRQNFLDRSVRSCGDQVLFNKRYEILVIDDSSIDRSVKKIKSLNLSNLKVIKNKKNMGIGYSSNLALKNSKGKYFIRVDSDDFLNKYALNDMTKILDYNKNIAMVYGDHFKVDENGLKEKLVKLNSLNKLKNHGAGIMFRTNVLKKIGGYNTKLRQCEDYDLITRIIKQGYDKYYLPIPYYRYYMHGSNITSIDDRSKYYKLIK
tara:strand:- start:637 stop:1296 length:660 start_codon:yes stop_codon:yes gene_type:complete